MRSGDYLRNRGERPVGLALELESIIDDLVKSPPSSQRFENIEKFFIFPSFLC